MFFVFFFNFFCGVSRRLETTENMGDLEAARFL